MISILDDENRIADIDKSRMLSAVLSAPGQINDAVKKSISFEPKKSFTSVVVAGMGGSAIAADIASNLFFNVLKKPLYISRDYNLPSYCDSSSFFIAISYSGNTEETLSALKQAEARGMQISCITSGGKLLEAAMQKKYPVFDLPNGFAPRAAFYSIFSYLVFIFEQLGLVEKQKEALSEAVRVIESLEIGPTRPERTNEAKLLARKIKGRIPVIFASSHLTEGCGLRLKNQFNENGKIPAFLSVFPELNHNELVGFSSLKKGGHNFSAILLRDEDENIRINKRIEITKSLIGTNLGGIHEIKSRGSGLLARLLSLIFYGDMLSVYSAISREVDPTPVDIIERLKKEIKR